MPGFSEDAPAGHRHRGSRAPGSSPRWPGPPPPAPRQPDTARLLPAWPDNAVGQQHPTMDEEPDETLFPHVFRTAGGDGRGGGDAGQRDGVRGAPCARAGTARGGGRSVRCTRPAPDLTAARIQDAYQAPVMFARGITGAGTVIAVIIPGTAPGIAADIAAYSRGSGLPVPDTRVLSYGDVRAVSTADGAAWVQEGVLDLEMAHTLARRAGRR